MDINLYTYNGQLFSICPTMPDNDSFFHSTLGVRGNEGEEYFDKHAQFRRMRWATFLTYYKNETMPPPLENALTECLSAIDKYRHMFMDDAQILIKYISDIIAAERNVTVEEIPLLATLENVRVVLLLSTESDAVLTVEPNADIFGSYSVPNVTEDPNEIILCLRGNTFSRLEPANEDSIAKFYKSVEAMTKKNPVLTGLGLDKYKKGGSAGSHGVQYQVNVLTIVLLNAFKNETGWRLSTENVEAEKFDDIVLECPDGGTFIQCKHRENQKGITLEELLSSYSKNSDFSLPKYFLSYLQLKRKFTVKNVIICMNVNIRHHKVAESLIIQQENSESLLYQENGYSVYSFNENIFQQFCDNVRRYQEVNNSKKDINRTDFSSETINDFFRHLQLYCNYAPLNQLKIIINKLLAETKYCSNSHDRISFTDLHPKVLDWFQQKQGVYITEKYAKSMFADIWRDKYYQKLEQYKVSFMRNDLKFHDYEQIFQVTCNGGCLLQALKIYQSLQDHKMKSLFVSSDDDADIQKLMLTAFEVPMYQYLIITWKETTQPIQICNELRGILMQYEYKKIILLGENNNILVEQIALEPIVKDIHVKFGDLSSASQKRLLSKKTVTLQGNSFSLKGLLGTQTTDYYNNVITTEILEKVVKGEEIKVGSVVQPLHEQTKCYYIPRRFTREIEVEERDETRKETYSEENIYEANDKFIIIENKGGMGKSTVLTNLAAVIKQKHPHLWVIRIEFDKYKDILKEFQKKGKTTIHVEELLNFHEATKLKTDFEKLVFSVNRKVVLMLDAVDEISDDVNPYLKLILSLFEQCQYASNIAKVFVASREHAIQALTEKLHVTPFKLMPFKPQDYIDFFVRFWTSKLSLAEDDILSKCRIYAEAVVNKMRGWINPDRAPRQRLVVVPLQLKMLAEIFQERSRLETSQDWDGCVEFLKADKPVPDLPIKVNIANLFTILIEKKGDFLIDEGTSSDRTCDKQMLLKKYKEYLNYRKML